MGEKGDLVATAAGATVATPPHTIERPGTGLANPIPLDPNEPRTADDGQPIGFSDDQWRTFQTVMAARAIRRDYRGRGTIRVHAGPEPDDSPDAYATLPASDKVMAALQQAVASGQVSADISKALGDLLSPDGLLALGAFTAAFIAAEAAGGPIAWFASALGILMMYIAFGSALLDLCDALINDVADAKNKRHFDMAVTKVAHALGDLSVTWLTAFAAMVLGTFGSKAKRAIIGEGAPAVGTSVEAPARPTDDPGFGARARNPALDEGGVRNLGPAEAARIEQAGFDAAQAKAEALAKGVNPEGGRNNCYNTARRSGRAGRRRGGHNCRRAGRSSPIRARSRAGREAAQRDAYSLDYFEHDFGTGAVPTTEADIAVQLHEAGPGSRGIVLGERPMIPNGQGGFVQQPGHAFNAVNIDGHVFFVDGQSGRIVTNWERFGFDRIKWIRTR